MLADDDFKMAPCLVDGPLADSGARLIEASRRLPSSGASTALRGWAVAAAFDAMERVFAAESDPRDAVAAALAEIATELDGFAVLGSLGAGLSDEGHEDVAAETGSHYGNLFAGFSPQAYFDEAANLLRTRLDRNGVAVPTRATVLDAGCGGGRYTVAWTKAGADRAVGIDISSSGVADARRRVEAAEISNVSFDLGSVLELPYEDSQFDVVFSNGVLHHSTDWVKGVHELVRVVRPGGLGWLYLIENPGGLFWDTIEILRVLMKGQSKAGARASLSAIGVPGNRIFYMLDHVMVPINLRLTADEITTALENAGATDIRRLDRGVDFDRVEAIHRGDPHAATKYGVGEHRFVFTKS